MSCEGKNQQQCYQDAVVLDSKAGDLIFFDTRIDHSPTLVTPGHTPKVEKLAIFLMAATRNEYAYYHTHFIRRRPDYEFLKTFTVPQDMLELAERHGVEFIY
jgi:hypothetical protein